MVNFSQMTVHKQVYLVLPCGKIIGPKIFPELIFWYYNDFIALEKAKSENMSCTTHYRV